MAIRLLKLGIDICWYMAALGPLFASLPRRIAVLCYLLPIPYCLLVLFKDKMTLSQFAPRDLLLWQFKILIGVTIVSIILGGLPLWERTAAPWLLACLIAGVLYLRLIRLGSAYWRDVHFWTSSLLYIFLVLSAALIATSPSVVAIFSWFAKALYSKIIAPILVTIFSVLGGALYAVVRFFASMGPNSTVKTLDELFLDASHQQNTITKDLDIGGPPIFEFVAIVILCLSVLLIVKLLLRKLSTKMEAGKTETGVRAYIGSEKPNAIKIPKERNVVRVYYKKFLKLYIKAKLLLCNSDSSEDVQKKAALAWNLEQLARLRRVYLQARYSDKDVTPEEINAAKDAYKKLKNTNAINKR